MIFNDKNNDNIINNNANTFQNNKEGDSPQKSSNVTINFIKRHRFFCYAMLPFLLFFFFHFSKVIFTDQQFCYRDFDCTFYPLYKAQQDSFNKGEIPLWDTGGNFGSPLYANPLAGVFYPPKIIFFLTLLFPGSFGICFKWFVILHYPLAYWGVWRLCRHWRFSMTASVIAAITYTFTTPLFIQYSILVFLIGGAWFPWAIYYGDRLLRENGIRPVIMLGAVLAMMVTGGEPEAAYVAGLTLCFLWIIYYRSGLLTLSIKTSIPLKDPVINKSTSDNSISNNGMVTNSEPQLQGENSSTFHTSESDPKSDPESENTNSRILKKMIRRNGIRRLFRLASGGLLGGILAMVVVLPAGELNTLGNRSSNVAPYSLWEIPGFLFGHQKNNLEEFSRYVPRNGEYSFWEGILCQDFKENSRQSDLQFYNLIPWEIPGFLWPNITGTSFDYIQWTFNYPNPNFWHPALYLGAIQIVLVFSAFVFWRRRKKSSFGPNDPRLLRQPIATGTGQARTTGLRQALSLWGSWIVLFLFIASLGAFSFPWFVRLFQNWPCSPEDLQFTNSDPLGGLYWLMLVFLPGYINFRYAAKLTLYMVFFFALLTGLSWDRGLKKKKITVLCIIFLILTALAVTIFCVTGMKPFLLLEDHQKLPESISIGIILQKTLISLAHTAAILVFFLIFRVLWKKRPHLRTGLTFLLLLILTGELLWVNAKFVPTRSDKTFGQKGAVYNTIVEDYKKIASRKSDHSVIVPPRYYYPQIIKLPLDDIAPEDRMPYMSQWNEDSLRPETFRLYPISCLEDCLLTFQAQGSEHLHYALDNFFVPDTPVQYQKKFMEIMAACGVDYFVFDTTERTFAGSSLIDGYYFSQNDLPSEKRKRLEDLEKKKWPLNTVLWRNDTTAQRARIVRQDKLSQKPHPLMRLIEDFSPNEKGKLSGEFVRFTKYERNSLELDVSLKEPGSIVLAEQFWPGWKATMQKIGDHSKPVSIKIYKDRNIFRKMDLPAGDYHVSMTFSPWRFKVGSLISLAGIVICLLLFFHEKRKRRSEQ